MSRVPAVFILKRQAIDFAPEALPLQKPKQGWRGNLGLKLSHPTQAFEYSSLAFLEVTQLLQLNLEFYSVQTPPILYLKSQTF